MLGRRGYGVTTNMDECEESMNLVVAFTLGLSEIRHKTQRCRKMCMTVFKMRITYKHKRDQNVCKLCFAECTLFHLQS